MCGRFSQAIPIEILLHLRAWRDAGAILDEAMINRLAADYEPNYNIAPSRPALIVRADGHGQTDAGAAVRLGASIARFGLIPSWAKDRSIGAKMINARAETIGEKPAFRGLVRSRRAVLPVDGFYEWQSLPASKAKRPWFFRRADGEPVLLACVWDTWLDPQAGSPVDSFSIITTAAGEQIQPIHHRTPVVLGEESLPGWFDRETPMNEVHAMLRPAGAGVLDMHPVSARVNSPANNDPALIERCDAPVGPASPDSAGSPPTLWG
ncbi:MAG: SOS response-associated peptidase [Phycisphaerales bacterium]